MLYRHCIFFGFIHWPKMIACFSETWQFENLIHLLLSLYQFSSLVIKLLALCNKSHQWDAQLDCMVFQLPLLTWGYINNINRIVKKQVSVISLPKSVFFRPSVDSLRWRR
jgi:hypothetical protein